MGVGTRAEERSEVEAIVVMVDREEEAIDDMLLVSFAVQICEGMSKECCLR